MTGFIPPGARALPPTPSARVLPPSVPAPQLDRKAMTITLSSQFDKLMPAENCIDGKTVAAIAGEHAL
jgi:hypothetical protein